MRDPHHQAGLGVDDSMPFHNFLVKFVGTDMLATQVSWLRQFDGSIALDYVGRFETLQADFDVACAQMKIEPTRLPHKIKGESQDYRTAISDSSRRLIADYYREEIDLYGYSFDS